MTAHQTSAPPLQFAFTRDGARIAYQDYGLADGPRVVAVPPLAQNIEMVWELPQAREMFERFGSFARWTPYDKRGTGCSDRRTRMPGIDERVEDLRAVMDAVGLDRAHLFGQSGGGPTTLMFAATYPERVETVTIFGSGARTTPHLDHEELVARKERYEWLASVWGTAESPMVDAFSPTMANDQEYREWNSRYERNSADSASLLELLEINHEVDVSEILPNIDVPVLVLHRSSDPIVPLDLARQTAAGIRNATLVEVDGVDHFGFAGDIHAWIDEVERFITGTVQHRPAPPARTTPEIVTMGRFTVVADGEEVPVSAWGARQARQLCKRLVAARGWPVPREELIDLLWPDDTDRRRLGARLSVQLSAVRKVLRGGLIANRETVALDLGEVSTDLERILTSGDDHLVVDIYGGDFLPEDRAEDWSIGARDEAKAAYVAAVRRLSDEARLADDHARAAVLSRRLVAVDRYEDHFHRQLVGDLMAADDRVQARAAHEAWRVAMAELDVEIPDLDDC
ncbi:MAG: alpha/beta fold hydrolase [Actinomycetota bacterium]